jgi:hypothetical protein
MLYYYETAFYYGISAISVLLQIKEFKFMEKNLRVTLHTRTINFIPCVQ